MFPYIHIYIYIFGMSSSQPALIPVGIPALPTPMGDLKVAPWLRKMVVSILQESKIAMENHGKIMGKS